MPRRPTVCYALRTGDIIEVPLGRRTEVALIDADDWSLISDYPWYCKPYSRGRHQYAVTEYHHRVMLMHRVILGCGPTVRVDHVNGNGLDNRRANLRLASGAQNAMNRRGANSNNACGVLGVYRHKRTGKWHAAIWLNHTSKNLGSFATIEDAIAARRAAEITYFGDFAPRR